MVGGCATLRVPFHDRGQVYGHGFQWYLFMIEARFTSMVFNDLLHFRDVWLLFSVKFYLLMSSFGISGFMVMTSKTFSGFMGILFRNFSGFMDGTSTI